ncbi:hypothetical protein B0T22DRAFT_299585 [Podospora appendiculata]|uniref:Uncharacterized protein n=1 Tax=Podospora appendiculata TaxID=314037 RepID=A0AAE0WZJ9_9PEZI|nr:hypothetical protein B0T22DRAFT_299585 [Podospora appendiculata]
MRNCMYVVDGIRMRFKTRIIQRTKCEMECAMPGTRYESPNPKRSASKVQDKTPRYGYRRWDDGIGLSGRFVEFQLPTSCASGEFSNHCLCVVAQAPTTQRAGKPSQVPTVNHPSRWWCRPCGLSRDRPKKQSCLARKLDPQIPNILSAPAESSLLMTKAKIFVGCIPRPFWCFLGCLAILTISKRGIQPGTVLQRDAIPRLFPHTPPSRKLIFYKKK